MAGTGIILRRKPTKLEFSALEAPIRGELIMATDSTEFGWLDDTNAVVWGRLENELPIEGQTGQALIKQSDDDYDVEWGDVSSGGGAPVEIIDFEKTIISSSGDAGPSWIDLRISINNGIPANISSIHKLVVSFEMIQGNTLGYKSQDIILGYIHRTPLNYNISFPDQYQNALMDQDLSGNVSVQNSYLAYPINIDSIMYILGEGDKNGAGLPNYYRANIKLVRVNGANSNDISLIFNENKTDYLYLSGGG